MTEREKYLHELKEFRNLLETWDKTEQTDDEIRSEINKRIKKVQNLAIIAGTMKYFSYSPPAITGGYTIPKGDPFVCIFTPPPEISVIPIIFDIIDETIGVIESDENFTLEKNNTEIKKVRDRIMSNQIFIVHGRDNELKETTARFLEKLSLEPKILHEQTSKGRTVIEKFEEHSDVAFAVVLMTPDDIGALSGEENKLQKRARQNVIFELGYFIGKLGRERVIALLKDDIEFPTDYGSVLYIKVDTSDGWKFQLAKELKAGGLEIDMNKI
ncbi:MAG: nucleotide-binding protein [Candidatus Delongbacteria bacterium]|jgi:predicted nucleotide-binding protein|nr:nucleotide-binding protein [Candidatus Delongbacteria bacterium]